MKHTTKIIIYSLILCILYWIMFAFQDLILSSGDRSLIQVLITGASPESLYTRIPGLIILIVLVLLVAGVRGKRGKERDKFTRDQHLIVNLSDQVRTPLNAIVGFSDLLEDEDLSPESRKLYVNNISAGGKYLFALVNCVSDQVKIETNQLRVKQSGCRVNKLLDEIHSKFDMPVNEKNKKEIDLVLKTGIKDDHFTILTDQEKLKQILTHLLENALSLTDEGTIEFGYKQKDRKSLEFYVKDTGVGLSLDRLEIIMEHFQKVLDKDTHPFDLIALRINISKHLAGLLGGKLSAESELLKGSTFSFTLPLKEIKVPEKEKLREADEKKSGTPAWNEKQMLIAEDIETNFIYLREVLLPTGIKLHWAKNGREAVDMFQTNRNIDLVLMDILMPEMDGYEAAKLIRVMDKDVPIIVQTAYSLDNEAEESLNSFNDFLTKPIWSVELTRVLSKYL